jgi:hypothetical protein
LSFDRVRLADRLVIERGYPHCTTVVRVTPRQYEAVRADPRWFINAAGHESMIRLGVRHLRERSLRRGGENR